MEEWRDVVGFEGWYQVSSVGRVKRVAPGHRARVGLILKPRYIGGYSGIGLSKSGKQVFTYAHTLVLEAFVSSHPPGHECNHKNGDKADNRPENLEWVTHSENRIHACQVLGKARGSNHCNVKLTEGEVLKIRNLYETGDYTYDELGEMFGCSGGNIGNIVTRRTWKHI